MSLSTLSILCLIEGYLVTIAPALDKRMITRFKYENAKRQTSLYCRLGTRGIHNYITKRPLAVGYEVTLSCDLNRRHCELRGIIEAEKQIKREVYGDLTGRLSPGAAVFCGGKPLLRQQIVAIVKAVRQADDTPYLTLVTNGVLPSESDYLQLLKLG